MNTGTELQLNALERIIWYGNRRRRLSVAIVLALFAHFVLVWLMPDLPELVVDTFSRDTGLLVTIEKREEPEVFEQALEQPLADQTVSEQVLSPSLAAASPEIGAEDSVSDDMPQIDGPAEDNQSSERNDDSAADAARPVIRFDFATVKLFVEQDAQRYQGRYPEQFARFARSFRSNRSVARRARTESFRNRVGDVSVRASASEGDICFKQEADRPTDEFQTRTVLFFRCGEQPMKLELGPEGG